MILILTASIMYWSLQQKQEDNNSTPEALENGENENSLADEVSNLAINDVVPDYVSSPKVENLEPSADIEDEVAS